MPCNERSHVHKWARNGGLAIQKCESRCDFCRSEKEYRPASALRKHVLTHIKNDGLSVTLEHSIGGRPKKVAKRSVDSDATCFNKKNIGTLLATQDLTPDGSSLARRPTSDGSTIPSSRVSTSPLLSSCGQTRLNTLQSQTQHESHDIISRWENLADTPSSTRRVGQDTPERNAESSKACRNCHATLNVCEGALPCKACRSRNPTAYCYSTPLDDRVEELIPRSLHIMVYKDVQGKVLAIKSTDDKIYSLTPEDEEWIMCQHITIIKTAVTSSDSPIELLQRYHELGSTHVLPSDRYRVFTHVIHAVLDCDKSIPAFAEGYLDVNALGLRSSITKCTLSWGLFCLSKALGSLLAVSTTLDNSDDTMRRITLNARPICLIGKYCFKELRIALQRFLSNLEDLSLSVLSDVHFEPKKDRQHINRDRVGSVLGLFYGVILLYMTRCFAKSAFAYAPRNILFVYESAEQDPNYKDGLSCTLYQPMLNALKSFPKRLAESISALDHDEFAAPLKKQCEIAAQLLLPGTDASVLEHIEYFFDLMYKPKETIVVSDDESSTGA